PVPIVPPWAVHVEPPSALLPTEVCHGCFTRPYDPGITVTPLAAGHTEGLSRSRHQPHQALPHRPRSTQCSPGPGLRALSLDQTPFAVEHGQYHPLRTHLLLLPDPAPSRRRARHALPTLAPAPARDPQRRRTRSPVRCGRLPATPGSAHDHLRRRLARQRGHSPPAARHRQPAHDDAHRQRQALPRPLHLALPAPARRVARLLACLPATHLAVLRPSRRATLRR